MPYDKRANRVIGVARTPWVLVLMGGALVVAISIGALDNREPRRSTLRCVSLAEFEDRARSVKMERE